MIEKVGHKTLHYLHNTFHSLENINFRYFWFGQCVSLIGTTMQRTAQYWLVYTLTKSPFLLGLLGVCQSLPPLLFSLFAGVIIDRMSKKKLIFITQSLFLVQASVLAALTFSGHIQYWHVLLLSFMYGVTLTFDMPARHAFVYELVGKDDIMNAVSLNSTVFNLSKIIGPAVAGFLMLQLGIGLCFLFNAISYIAVIGGIFLIKIEKLSVVKIKSNIFKDILDGMKYIKSSRILVVSVLIFGIVNAFAMNNDVIIPVFSKTVLGMAEEGYTSLLTAAGVGSLAGAITMASISKKGLNKSLLIYSAIGTSLLLMCLFFISDYGACLVLLAVIGFLNIIFFNTANIIFQTNSSDEYRGRVMSVYSLLIQGLIPIGNFYVGTVMENLGGNSGFISCGAASLLFLIPVLIFNRSIITAWMVKKNSAPIIKC